MRNIAKPIDRKSANSKTYCGGKLLMDDWWITTADLRWKERDPAFGPGSPFVRFPSVKPALKKTANGALVETRSRECQFVQAARRAGIS